MPTNDERREVAARLRKAWISGCAFATFFEFDCGDFETCQECSEYCTKHLADLIEPEERTCRMTKYGAEYVLAGWWACSECGPVYPPCNDEIAVWALQKCSRCGAKVVEE